MWRRDPRAVMVIAGGRCTFIGEAKWDEFGYAQEALPDGIRVLLCLIDGAERRQSLLKRWSVQSSETRRRPVMTHVSLHPTGIDDHASDAAWSEIDRQRAHRHVTPRFELR
jgi:hypothetical protein